MFYRGIKCVVKNVGYAMIKHVMLLLIALINHALIALKVTLLLSQRKISQFLNAHFVEALLTPFNPAIKIHMIHL
jgi:hypothetical protein